MGEDALVDIQVTGAIELLRKLDDTGHGPSLAAWYYYDDANEWRLLIASSELDTLLSKQEALAYRVIVSALTSLQQPSLGLSQLKIIGTTSPLAKAFSFLLKTAPNGIVQAHFTNMTLNGLFLKEVILLRSA